MNTVNEKVLLQDDWQSSKRKLIQRVDHVFGSYMLSDVQFLVGKDSSKQRIPAHKFVLSIGSSVFCAMFYGDLAMNAQEIEISDIEPKAFLALLKFLYSDTVVLFPEMVLSTMYASKKYAVRALEDECSKFLQSSLTHKNAFMLLTQARLFNDTQLESRCLRIIDENPNAFKSADFIDIDLDLLCSIICRDTLLVPEIELFHAAIKWSKAECERKKIPVTKNNQKIVMGPAIKLIRFPLMTIDKFSENIIESGLLTDEEITSIMKYISAKTKPSVEFPCSPRYCQIAMQEFSVCRFLKNKPRPVKLEVYSNSSGCCHSIRFIVDCPIIICGFNVYNYFTYDKPKPNFIAYIELCNCYDDYRRSFLGAIKKMLKSNSSTPISQVRFQKPILLQGNHCYEVEFKLRVLNLEKKSFLVYMYSGFDGKSKVSVKSPKGKINFKFLSEYQYISSHINDDCNPDCSNEWHDDDCNSDYSDEWYDDDCIIDDLLYTTGVASGQIPQIIFKLPVP